MPISANSLSSTDVCRQKVLMQFSDKIIGFTNVACWAFVNYIQASKPQFLKNIIHAKSFTKTTNKTLVLAVTIPAKIEANVHQ